MGISLFWTSSLLLFLFCFLFRTPNKYIQNSTFRQTERYRQTRLQHTVSVSEPVAANENIMAGRELAPWSRRVLGCRNAGSCLSKRREDVDSPHVFQTPAPGKLRGWNPEILYSVPRKHYDYN